MCVQILFKMYFLPHSEHMSCLPRLMPFGETLQFPPWIAYNTYVHSMGKVQSFYLLMQVWWITFCYLPLVLGVIIFLLQTSLSEIKFVSPFYNVTPTKIVINYKDTSGVQRKICSDTGLCCYLTNYAHFPKQIQQKPKRLFWRVIP
jgi:hypothetical protein